MILNLDKDDGTLLYVDIDKISLIDVTNNSIIIDGLAVMLPEDAIKDVHTAFVSVHKSHMYDDSIGKIRWIKGEN